tara:strand:+ start:159 stop:1061 length:903 start_codon:yes stop_codon:yes gene_type:complete
VRKGNIIAVSKPKVIWNLKCFLGEGVLWVKEHNSIYFVDIKRKKIYSFNISTRKKKIYRTNLEIGFLAHIKDYIFALGLQKEIKIQDLKTKKIIKSIPVETKIKFNRINDGKTDLSGRLWFGTMDNLERNRKKGSLYCLDKKLKLKKVDENYIITNGPAFISNNSFYHNDSRKKIIFKIKIDKKLKILKKRIFKKFSEKDGSPDGMTVDQNKNLWVCHYRGGCISIFNKFGKKIKMLKLPAKNITNCSFGGKNNSYLFVTTARKGMKTVDIKNYNLSGSLFKIKTNTKGLYHKKFETLLC